MDVLVVEDDLVSREIISRFLKEQGYDVTGVNTADEAWALFQRKPFRIVFTDWRMPGMSGLELCRRIREKTADDGYCYLIMLTANSNNIAGLSAGADDFVVKPFDPDELRFRLNTAVRVLGLEDRRSQEHRLLAKSRQELKQTYDRLRGELDAAREFQQSLLPSEEFESEPVRHAWKYLPSADLGGDYFSVRRLAPGRIGILMADVCGKGVRPSFLAVTLHFMTDPRSRQSPLLWSDQDMSPAARVVSPPEVLRRLNEQFPADALVTQYFTLFYGVLETDTGRFNYATAGHPPPFLVSEHGDVHQLPGCGVPIGLHDEPGFEGESTVLKAGDRLLLVSDGVTESHNAADEMIGADRFADWIREAHGLPLSHLLESLSQSAQDWSVGDHPNDDLSFLALEYTAKEACPVTTTKPTDVMRRV